MTLPTTAGVGSAQADRTRPSRNKATPGAASRRRRRGVVGWLYALPTALFVCLLFVWPIVLVFRMSASHWPLLTGNQGWNFPTNYQKVFQNRFFLSSTLFTLKYTFLATVLLLGLGLGLALLVQESTRWKGLLRTTFLIPSALGLASASLLFYALYSPQSSPLNPIFRALGWTDGTIAFLGTPSAALWSTLLLIVWRYAGFYMLILLVGLQRIPQMSMRPPESTGQRADRYSPESLCRCSTLAGPLAHPVCHRIAAGIRPVLHPHQGRTGQQHDHRGATDLQLGFRRPERSRTGRGDVGDRPHRPHRDQSPAVQGPSRRGRLMVAPVTSSHTSVPGGAATGTSGYAFHFSRIPYYVFTAALAILFLFPLAWAGVASVSPRPGTNQVHGFGFGNYERWPASRTASGATSATRSSYRYSRWRSP